MDRASVSALVSTILRLYGRTFSHELNIPIEDNTAPALFQLLSTAILLNRQVRLECGLQAARAIIDEGWISPELLAQSTWEERAAVLRQAGYPHHDTVAQILGEAADLLLDWYEGDVHQLRQEARYDQIQERVLIKKIKGIGDSGADLFFREVQVIWDEVFPFTDQVVSESAEKFGLPADPSALASLTSREDFVRLAAGLVRIREQKAFTHLRQECAVNTEPKFIA